MGFYKNKGYEWGIHWGEKKGKEGVETESTDGESVRKKRRRIMTMETRDTDVDSLKGLCRGMTKLGIISDSNAGFTEGA